MTRRWMLFVDGENLTLRAQEFADRCGLQLTEGNFYMRHVLVWMPESPPLVNLYVPDVFRLEERGLRAHYYTSVQGDDGRIEDVRKSLRRLNFDVFPRSAGAEDYRAVVAERLKRAKRRG